MAVLESHGEPASHISMTTKSVMIDNESYDLDKTISLDGKDISLYTTSITIDEDGGIDSSSSSARLARSDSRISLHGIEVPTSLFPETWAMNKNQVRLAWPLPILLVVDICGARDLDLNSSRTQILISEKWINFEETLAQRIFSTIQQSVNTNYWDKLKDVVSAKSKNEVINKILNDM